MSTSVTPTFSAAARLITTAANGLPPTPTTLPPGLFSPSLSFHPENERTDVAAAVKARRTRLPAIHNQRRLLGVRKTEPRGKDEDATRERGRESRDKGGYENNDRSAGNTR
ncbi:hypothetical protein KM043_008463 [Ampulex compressa]|nr:hypothetical protein KM043_008463 [Ampulex compressa]